MDNEGSPHGDTPMLITLPGLPASSSALFRRCVFKAYANRISEALKPKPVGHSTLKSGPR